MYADDTKCLLPGDSDDDRSGIRKERGRFQLRSWGSPLWCLALLTGLFISLFTNGVLLTLLHLKMSTATGPRASSERPSYSGLKYEVPTDYTYYTKYWNESGVLNEELWDAISIDPAMIAVMPEWAAARGLPPSSEFPWDPSKQMYFIKVFHQLHCLKSLRLAFKAYEEHRESPSTSEHVAHCLDALRQDLTCHADDTPMASQGPGQPFGVQVNQCMDFEKLVAWTQHPERNACHRHVNESTTLYHSIERFAFCPPDSPYFPVMTAYFEEHGHYEVGF